MTGRAQARPLKILTPVAASRGARPARSRPRGAVPGCASRSVRAWCALCAPRPVLLCSPRGGDGGSERHTTETKRIPHTKGQGGVCAGCVLGVGRGRPPLRVGARRFAAPLRFTSAGGAPDPLLPPLTRRKLIKLVYPQRAQIFLPGAARWRRFPGFDALRYGMLSAGGLYCPPCRRYMRAPWADSDHAKSS